MVGEDPGRMAILWIIAILGIFLVWDLARRDRRLRRGKRRIEEAWAEVERAFSSWLQALEGFAGALRRKGYVPRARQELEELLREIRASQGPKGLEEALDRVQDVLHRLYAALPRRRLPEVKEAQNELARCAEELDLVRRRYNELVRIWNTLILHFPNTLIASRRGYKPRELFGSRFDSDYHDTFPLRI